MRDNSSEILERRSVLGVSAIDSGTCYAHFGRLGGRRAIPCKDFDTDAKASSRHVCWALDEIDGYL